MIYMILHPKKELPVLHIPTTLTGFYHYEARCLFKNMNKKDNL